GFRALRALRSRRGGLLLGFAPLRGFRRLHLDQLDLPACLLDLLARRRADLVCAHRDGLGQLAVTEDLEPVSFVLDRASGDERLERHRLARAEPVEIANVHDRVLDPERIREAALREASLDRHLPALEAEEVHVARARLLSLAAAAGGLAGTARLAPPDPLALLHSAAARGSQSAQLVHGVPLTQRSAAGGRSLRRLALLPGA